MDIAHLLIDKLYLFLYINRYNLAFNYIGLSMTIKWGGRVSNIKLKFGKRLKELRKKKGLSQELLAEYIGIESRNLSKIETGITFPSIKNLEKIISVLGCKDSDLFNFDHLDTPNNLKLEITNLIKNMSSEKLIYAYKFLKSIE